MSAYTVAKANYYKKYTEKYKIFQLWAIEKYNNQKIIKLFRDRF